MAAVGLGLLPPSHPCFNPPFYARGSTMSDTRVVAHFFVQSVTITGKESLPDPKNGPYSSKEGPRDVGSVKLGAVVRGDLNKEWSAYTPYGTIELGTVNADAFADFVEHMGEEFEVTFRPLHTKNGAPIG